MNRFVYIITFSLAIFLTFYLWYEPTVKITNYPSSGTSIIAFGDSLVEGVGSTEGGGFVKMLSEDLNIPIINLGESGNTTKDALNRVGQISKYKPKVVLVLLGGNDSLQRVPKEETFSNLDKIITSIQQTGAVVLLVGIEGHVISNRDRDFFEELVKKYGTAYVPDILGGIFGQPELMSDNLHPNDKGYRIMAERIRPVLESVI